MREDLSHLPPALRALGADLDIAMRSAERCSGRLATRPVALRAGGRRRWLVRFAALATAMAGVSAIALSLRSGSPAAPQSAVAAVLQRLASAATTQLAYAPGPGQYLHSGSRTESTIVQPTGRGSRPCETRYSESLEDWVAPGGAALRRETLGAPRYSSPADRRACQALAEERSARRRGSSERTYLTQAAGAAAQDIGTTERMFGPGPGGLLLSTVNFQKLPLDPAKLRARLLTGKVEGGPPGAAEAFGQVADLLRRTDAPPRVRAALFHAASGLPGIRSGGVVTDSLGRRGVALLRQVTYRGRFGGRVETHELIFNAKTSALMEERTTETEANGMSESVTATAYLQSKVVSKLPVSHPLPRRNESIVLCGPPPIASPATEARKPSPTWPRCGHLR